MLSSKGIFNSMVHQGRDLSKRKKQRVKRGGDPYYNVKDQNQFLMKNIFDAMGNYVYHRNCVIAVFGVGSARLARLRKVVQKSHSTLTIMKEKVPRVSDVILPMDCSMSPAEWLDEQPESSDIFCVVIILKDMETLVKNLIMQRIVLYFRSFWSLLIIIVHLMGVK